MLTREKAKADRTDTARRVTKDDVMHALRAPRSDKQLERVSRLSNAIPTGLLDLDELFGGGLHPGEIGIVLAATNVGKSMTLAYFAAQAWLANKRVLYCTFELTEALTARRVAAAILRKPIRGLPKQPDDVLDVVADSRGLDRARLFVTEDLDTVAELRAATHEYSRRGVKPDLVILDSADDLRSSCEKHTPYEAQHEIYTQLLGILRDQDIALWISAQATVDAVDKARVSLRQMEGCLDKARLATIVLGLGQALEQLDDPAGPTMTLSVLKNGSRGTGNKHYRVRVRFGRGPDGWPDFIRDDPFDEHWEESR